MQTLLPEISKLPAALAAVTPATGVVVFAPGGSSQTSAAGLAEELASFGAQVLIVDNGGLRSPGESAQSQSLDDAFLSPLVDILPVLLYADALALRRMEQTGFRRIGKVVTTL